MWKDFVGRDFDRGQFTAYVDTLKWSSWHPRGLCLHNTAAPTLAQWSESGASHDARIRNLQQYYEGLGWHAGPHLFISREHITVFSPLTAPGVHSRCFNAEYFGVEMVGDYDKEPFDTGDGALVRDNAAFAVATLMLARGFAPETDLVFHRDCPKDQHACPGKLVSKSAMITRIRTQMETLQTELPLIMPRVPITPTEVSSPSKEKQIQHLLNLIGESPPLAEDGDIGPVTLTAVYEQLARLYHLQH